MQANTALVTGCSSGIGRAIALELLKKDWIVYASARRPETIADLAAAGCRTLALDVCDPQSRQAAVAAIEAEHGALGLLVNNAGYSQSGALESLDDAQVQRQFETNVFGVLALTRLALPGMRRQGGGRIITIGSIAGRLTFPGGGLYHMSKHALEAMHDALRFELAGFGIQVSLVQPGLIKSNFAQAGGATIPQGGVYAGFNRMVGEVMDRNYKEGFLAALAGSPADVARVVARASRRARPRTRYTVSPSATLLLTLRRLLGDRSWDRFLGLFYEAPRQADAA